MKRNNIILLILAIVFICPGLAAYAFYTHPQWLGSNAINKGTLLNPPERLLINLGKPKWRLVLWNADDCKESCLAQLDKLARIRLALGRRLYEVDEFWVVNKSSAPLPDDIVKSFHEHDVHFVSLSAAERQRQSQFTKQSQVFLANPDDYLVLAYALDANPADIFHDIQQLLRTTKRKSD